MQKLYAKLTSFSIFLCSNFLTKYEITNDVSAGRRAIKQEVKMGEWLHSDDRVQQANDWDRVRGETSIKMKSNV